MSKSVNRQTLIQFGASGSTTNFAEFGSLVAGTPVKTKSIATIQALTAWVDGLQDSIYTSNKAALLQDMNSLFYVAFYELFYLLQEGIPEWDSGTTYFIGSTVRAPGAADLFQSLADTNLNQALPASGLNNSYWQWLNTSQSPSGMVQAYAGATPPAGYLLCDGSAVSRTTYARLFTAIGTAWGSGDGTTTFNVPDLRGRALLGAGSGSGLTTRTLATKSGTETHSHTVSGHTHSIPQASVEHKHLTPVVVNGSNQLEGIYNAGYGFSATDASGASIWTVGGTITAISGSKFALTNTIEAYANGATGSTALTTASQNQMNPFGVVNFIISI